MKRRRREKPTISIALEIPSTPMSMKAAQVTLIEIKSVTRRREGEKA